MYCYHAMLATPPSSRVSPVRRTSLNSRSCRGVHPPAYERHPCPTDWLWVPGAPVRPAAVSPDPDPAATSPSRWVSRAVRRSRFAVAWLCVRSPGEVVCRVVASRCTFSTLAPRWPRYRARSWWSTGWTGCAYGEII